MAREKYSVEFLIRSSPAILYRFLTTPSGLIQWFCDSCDVTEDVYEFGWDGAIDLAELEIDIEDEQVQFHWQEAPENEFFRFDISKSEISNDTVLTVTDFADDYDVEDQRLLWQNQLEQLARACGGA